MVQHHQPYRERVSQIISWGHWFALFNILLAILAASRYLLVSDWPATLTGRIYSYISLTGHISFLVFLAYLLILFPLSFILPSQRWLRFIATIIATAGMSLLLIDSMMFTRFHLHINGLVWQLLLSPEKNELIRRWQAIFIIVPIILLIEMVFASWSWQKLRSLTRHRRYARPVALLLFLAFLATHIMYIWADANFYRPITMQRYTLPLSYPMTARGFLAKHGLLNPQAYQQRQLQQGPADALALQYPLSPLRYQDKGAGYNLLLITINQLNHADYPSQMPALAQFASNNISFSQHFSSGNQPADGIFGLFYGISPSYLDSVLASRTAPALLNALNHQGYQLGLFSSDGFNEPLYRQALISDFSVPAPYQQSDARTVSQWQQWLDNYTSAHNLWFSWLALNGNSKPGQPLHTAQVADQQIQRILKKLDDNGLLNNTVVVITAASGLAVAPSSAPSGASSPTSSPALSPAAALPSAQPANFPWSRDSLRVPLIIHWPGTPAQQITQLTGHTDIMVTLMRRLLHVSTPASEYAQGEDLFNANRKHPWIISAQPGTLAVTTPKQTLILHNGDYQLYDHQGRQIIPQTPPTDLLLQVLTENRRFIAY